jgi:hypothetical protein
MEHNMNENARNAGLSLPDLGADLGADHGAVHGAVHGAARGGVRRAVAPGAPSAPCPPALPGGHGGRRAHIPGATAVPPGADHGAGHGAAAWMDAEYVQYRLEEAGTALLAMPNTGYSTRLRSGALEVVHTALEAYGWDDAKLRPARPDAARITRMDEALGWIVRIPRDRYVLRRIVGARALVSPTTERHLYPWRRLGMLLGADHKAVQRWHAQGIALIVASLNAG